MNRQINMKKIFFLFQCLLFIIRIDAQKTGAEIDLFSSRFDRLNNTTFPMLELEDSSGKIFNTAVLTGKVIYVDFWFTACPPCIKEIPYSKRLQHFFDKDTSIVFLSICIENKQRKAVWKQMIKDREMPGIHLFYSRNQPQSVNLLRKYDITFPTYLIVNKEMKIVGYDAPRPSEMGWVHWGLQKAKEGKRLAESYREVKQNAKEFDNFLLENKENF